MNTKSASFKLYWEPSYAQYISLSLATGTIASFLTYPLEFIKTIIQFQATAVGFRGKRGKYSHIKCNSKDIVLLRSLGKFIRQDLGFQDFTKVLMPTWLED